MKTLSAIRNFARPRPVIKTERCTLCGLALIAEHPHLVEKATGKLLCACDGCAILFDGNVSEKFRRVSRDVHILNDFNLSDELWDRLGIPIGMSFFYRHGSSGKIRAIYPSPAGPMESLLPLDVWDEVVRDNPQLKSLEPDIEGLLIHRVHAKRAYYRIPIDECYRLIGVIRAKWQGFSGGDEVTQAIDAFFNDLNVRGKVRA